jgi:uracil-DNA glycosylase
LLPGSFSGRRNSSWRTSSAGRGTRAQIMRWTETRLHRRFKADQYPSRQWPRGLEAKLLVDLLGVYEGAGLSPGTNVPLCRGCPHAPSCWANGHEYQRVPRRGAVGDGGICLPWVGRDYRPQRDVVTVAINPNLGPGDPSDLLIEHGITWDHHVVGLALNDRSHEGSRFAFGAMRGAAALLDVADGIPVRDREPHELAGLVRRVARLQAVKCIPRTPTSKPLPNMWRNCPQFLLGQELDILRPQFILTLGTDPRRAVSGLDGYRQRRCRAQRVHHGELVREGWQATVFGVDHPRSGHASETSLISTLQRMYRPAARRSH